MFFFGCCTSSQRFGGCYTASASAFPFAFAGLVIRLTLALERHLLPYTSSHLLLRESSRLPSPSASPAPLSTRSADCRLSKSCVVCQLASLPACQSLGSVNILGNTPRAEPPAVPRLPLILFPRPGSKGVGNDDFELFMIHDDWNYLRAFVRWLAGCLLLVVKVFWPRVARSRSRSWSWSRSRRIEIALIRPKKQQ